MGGGLLASDMCGLVQADADVLPYGDFLHACPNRRVLAPMSPSHSSTWRPRELRFSQFVGLIVRYPTMYNLAELRWVGALEVGIYAP